MADFDRLCDELGLPQQEVDDVTAVIESMRADCIIQDGEAKRLPPLCDEADLSPDSQPLDSDSDSC